MVIPKGNLRTVVVVMAGQRPWSLSHTYSDCVCTHPLASRSHEPRRRLCVARLFCLLFREGDPFDETLVRAYHRVLSKTGFRWTAIMYANGHCASRVPEEGETAAVQDERWAGRISYP
ncbi:unnamed protein product [Lasius platythorax]|uniref:Uncharacterized protein n=1 Tax=Lasius platythorax TaxID=488582 RepID=A0AAV2P0U3_9HYME